MKTAFCSSHRTLSLSSRPTFCSSGTTPMGMFTCSRGNTPPIIPSPLPPASTSPLTKGSRSCAALPPWSCDLSPPVSSNNNEFWEWSLLTRLLCSESIECLDKRSKEGTISLMTLVMGAMGLREERAMVEGRDERAPGRDQEALRAWTLRTSDMAGRSPRDRPTLGGSGDASMSILTSEGLAITPDFITRGLCTQWRPTMINNTSIQLWPPLQC